MSIELHSTKTISVPQTTFQHRAQKTYLIFSTHKTLRYFFNDIKPSSFGSDEYSATTVTFFFFPGDLEKHLRADAVHCFLGC